MDPSEGTVELKVLADTTLICYGIDSCSHLKRMLTALRYFELLSAAKGRDKAIALFGDFCDEHYPLFLSDYIHFTRRHIDDAEHIKEAAAQGTYSLKGCSASHCAVQRRSSRRRGAMSQQSTGTGDARANFYGDIVANTHFLLHHLREHGLRTIPTTAKRDTKVGDEDADELEWTDEDFAQKAAQIAKSKKGCGTMAQLGDSNKFNIDGGGAGGQKKGKATMMDAVYSFLSCHAGKGRERVCALLAAEEYDSESFQIDLDFNRGNIADGDHALRCDIRPFLDNYRVSAYSFSTGFAFQYHVWYKDEENARKFQKRRQQGYDPPDYGGHELATLYVGARFPSLKSEVLNSKHLDVAEFNEFIVDKAKRFIASARCKAIRCREFNRFGIKGPTRKDFVIGEFNNDGAPLNREHLHALFLYTDWSTLSTAFSASFRAAHRGERLESIKARNGKFHHFAKRLKELVICFGKNGGGAAHVIGRIETFRGSFYCGMSVVLNIPQFTIRLYGPTSTSLHIEVAMRFGGTNGMIIELSNKFHPAIYERFFECEWLSAFPEESERLFMGGRNSMQLESVRIVETKDNYRRFLRAFYKFDGMLSGLPLHKFNVRASDARMVSGCMSHFLGIKSNGYPSFVHDTFRLFCARKTHIALNLFNIYNFTSYSTSMFKSTKCVDFMSLIMNEMKKGRKAADVSDNDINLVKPVLFELFRNVREVHINADTPCDSNIGGFAFNVQRLLAYDLSEALKVVIINGNDGDWLKDMLTGSVKQAIADQGWRVEELEGDRYYRVKFLR